MPFNLRKRLPLLFCLFVLGPHFAVHGFPSNSWKHLESAHFVVSYNPRTAELADKAVTIAEEVYDTLADYFGYRAGRSISIVLLDQSDDPNGATSTRDPLVSVDCRKAQMLFRGETDWLRTVLSHELSHALSLQTLSPPVVVGTTVGVVSTAENIDAAATHFWGVNEVPEWFLEGIAQLGSYHFKADFRDPIREMLLRDAVRGGSLLSLDEMARFEGTSLTYEMVYNQGFSFILYLEETYGNVTMRRLCANTARSGLRRALEICYGKPAGTLYEEWTQSLRDRYADGETWSVGQPLVQRGDPLRLEVASARSGELVIANWGNDYARFGLFQKAKNGNYRQLRTDTGLVLKEDAATGAAWFNASVYNYATGVDDYDVFRVGKDGRVLRVTYGARCLAFDAREDHLVYARYRDGKTDIVQRAPDGKETVLSGIEYGTAVYSISLLTRDTALLTVGTGDGVRLGILANGHLELLWKDQEIIDAASVGDNRVLLASTRSGAPQIYWADLKDDPSTWFQVTSAPGGARFPTFSREPAAAVFSVFEKGGYRLYTIADPFTRDHPVSIEGAATSEAAAATPAEPGTRSYPATRTVGNAILGAPTFQAQFFAIRAFQGTDVITVPQVAIAASDTLYNAPENLGLDASAVLYANIYRGIPLTPDINLALTGFFDLWQLQNLLQYTVQTQTYYLGPGFIFSYIQNDLYAQTEYQLSSYNWLTAFYDYSWLGDSLSSLDLFYSAHTTGLRWQYSNNPAYRFDPANLGQPLVSFSAGADARYQSFPVQGAFNPDLYLLNPQWTFKLLAGTELRALLFGSRLSADLKVDGFYLVDDPSAPTPYLQPDIGGETLFSGYPSGYALVNTMVHAALELRTNPLVDRNGRTSWYQRLSLGAKVEAGAVQYFSDTLAIGYPVSVEGSLRLYFYLAPNRESVLYLKVGVPLNDFLQEIFLPVQIYGGYSY